MHSGPGGLRQRGLDHERVAGDQRASPYFPQPSPERRLAFQEAFEGFAAGGAGVDLALGDRKDVGLVGGESGGLEVASGVDPVATEGVVAGHEVAGGALRVAQPEGEAGAPINQVLQALHRTVVRDDDQGPVARYALGVDGLGDHGPAGAVDGVDRGVVPEQRQLQLPEAQRLDHARVVGGKEHLDRALECLLKCDADGFVVAAQRPGAFGGYDPEAEWIGGTCRGCPRQGGQRGEQGLAKDRDHGVGETKRSGG